MSEEKYRVLRITENVKPEDTHYLAYVRKADSKGASALMEVPLPEPGKIPQRLRIVTLDDLTED